MEMDVPDGKLVVHTSTPSYVGSHVTGFFNMMCGFINYLSQSSGKNNGKVAIFPGFLNPGDLREMKRIAEVMKAPYIMFPDQSGVMDAPMTGRYEMYPKGGTTLDEIIALGDCEKVLALGKLTSLEPANLLKRKCKVPYELMPLPIGIEGTDRFIMELSTLAQADIPAELEEERGQLIDVMLDAHFYYHGKTVAVFGDPDTVLGLTQLVLEMGMIPKYVITGTPGEAFEKHAKELFDKFNMTDCVAKANADLFELHQWIKNEPVDLLLGTSYGKQIAKAENIPFVRAGFPVLDRYAHSYFPITGYKGALRLVELIANALLDKFDRECADEDADVVM
jgi:nitrogenase molybdenum-iron protein beta chain